MEVFDRTSKYDPNIDAIVRVEARRLRGKLKAYYEEGQGTADSVLIGLRPGSYVPVFRWLDAQPAKHRDEIGAAPSHARLDLLTNVLFPSQGCGSLRHLDFQSYANL
jgi:adenylate cyclase